MDYFKKNNLLFGIIMGVALPIITAAFVMIILEQIIKMGGGEGSDNPIVRPRTVYLVGICTNALIVNYYKKIKFDLTMRGIVIATALLGILWVVRFGSEIINQM